MKPTVLPTLLAVTLLAGCASSARLYDERTSPSHARYVQAAGAFCPTSSHVRAEDPGACPLHVHVEYVRAPVGAPAAKPDDPLLVLVPGVMSDRFSWRFLWPLLARRYDLLLIDLPGQGLSDKPPESIAPDAYSPAWLGRHVLRAVRTWQMRRGDTRRVVLVGHSLGSTALLRAMADPGSYSGVADLIHRVDCVVTVAVAELGMKRVNEVFEDLEGLSTFEVEAGSALGMVQQRVREGIPKSVVAPEHAFCAEADRLQGIVQDPCTRRAAQSMLRRFRPVDRCRRPLWDRIAELETEYRNVTKPILILWGAQDTTLDPRSCARIAAQFPDARCELVPSTRHSPHQERPEHVASRIVAFIEGPR